MDTLLSCVTESKQKIDETVQENKKQKKKEITEGKIYSPSGKFAKRAKLKKTANSDYKNCSHMYTAEYSKFI